MMNKSQILKKIGNIIEELSEQQQYLASTNKINLLELELFTANADFLIDHIEILKKLNDIRFDKEEKSLPLLEEKPEINQQSEPKVAKETIETPAQEEPIKKFSFSFDDEPTEMIFDFEKKIAVDEVFDRPLNDDERRLLEEKTSAPAEKPEEFIVLDSDETENDNSNIVEKEDDIEPFLVVKETVPENKSTSEISSSKEPKKDELNAPATEEKVNVKPEEAEISLKQEPEIVHSVASKTPEKQVDDTNKQIETAIGATEKALAKEGRPLTLNEMLSAKLSQGGAQSNQRQSKKLEDLKTAISINDKMVFIKELFNGYNLAYSEAIEIVNRFESFDAADNFLQKNYSLKNDWESKQVTVARFYEYLHKKFVM